jgi:hypothetical protein
VETQLRVKPLRGSQIQDIHYSEDIESNTHIPDAAIVSSTLTCNLTRTPPNQVTYLKGSSIESFTLGPTPKIEFNFSIGATHNDND